MLGPLTTEQLAVIRKDSRLNKVRLNDIGQLENLDRRYVGRLPRLALQFMKVCLRNDP